jgi:hypothetical protein
MIALLMPGWLSSVESLKVTVNTGNGAEVVSEEMNLTFPFMIDEQTEKLIAITP